MIRLDIGGPKGNAFYILGLVKTLVGDDKETAEMIREEMQSGDYDNLLKVFKEAFPMVELYSNTELGSVDKDLYTITNNDNIEL